jgi:hypothetical protein
MTLMFGIGFFTFTGLACFGVALQTGAQMHFGLPFFRMQRLPAPQAALSQLSGSKRIER